MGSESGVATRAMPKPQAWPIDAASVLAGAVLAAGLGLGLSAQAQADITTA